MALQLLRWHAPRQRRVLYVDGEMPLVSLQERLRAISAGLGAVIPNDGFRVLAADNTENGLSIGSEEGQRAIDPLLTGVDLVIFDNLSTLCTNGSESASDAWVPMQNWLLKLRRQGIAVLLVHHAGTNGRQRGTSRREDALDTVIALRRPEDYSPEQGARFEVHFEKLRNRVDGDAAVPFEAKLEAISADETNGVRWLDCDLRPPVLKQAAQLFKDGLSVREVAVTLRVSKTEAGRLRLRASLMDCLCRTLRRPSPGEWSRSGAVDRYRSDFTHPGLRSISAATWTCVLGVVPVPMTHSRGTLGRPPNASKCDWEARWCNGCAGVLIPQSPKTAILLATVFTCRASGEKIGATRHRMPPRDWEAPTRPYRRPTVQVKNMRRLS